MRAAMRKWIGAGVASAMAMLSGVASGAELWVATSFSVLKGDSVTGGFVFAGPCGGQIRSMTQNSRELLLGTASGDVYRFNMMTGQIVGQFSLPSDCASMVVHQDQLYVGGTSGSVLRVNPVTGAVLETRQLPTGDASVIAVRNGKLVVGGASTFVYKAPLTGGNFTFFTGCFAPVRSMAFRGGRMLLGSDSSLYSFDENNAAYYGTTPLSFAAEAMVADGTALVVGSPDGTVRRFGDLLVRSKVIGQISGPVEAMIVPVPMGCGVSILRGGSPAAGLAAFVDDFGAGSVRADVNNDGRLDVTDFVQAVRIVSSGCRDQP